MLVKDKSYREVEHNAIKFVIVNVLYPQLTQMQ